MKLKLLFHSAERKKTAFITEEGTRPFGILMVISAGKYNLSFPKSGHTCTILPNEVSYIPPKTHFIRHIEEAIDFHHFFFQIEEDHPFFDKLRPGKLTIPPSQVAAILQSLSHSIMLPQYTELLEYELEHIIAENHIFTWQASANTRSDDIRRVIHFMEKHLSEKINMDMLTAEAFLSCTGLIQKFRRQLGTTPLNYLIMLRMNLAKELLLKKDLSVAQIAERCGYSNAYYFSNTFHKFNGMSPTAFRKFSLGQK